MSYIMFLGLYYRRCKLVSKTEVTHDTRLLCLMLPKSTHLQVPTGHHVYLKQLIAGKENWEWSHKATCRGLGECQVCGYWCPARKSFQDLNQCLIMNWLNECCCQAGWWGGCHLLFKLLQRIFTCPLTANSFFLPPYLILWCFPALSSFFCVSYNSFLSRQWKKRYSYSAATLLLQFRQKPPSCATWN